MKKNLKNFFNVFVDILKISFIIFTLSQLTVLLRIELIRLSTFNTLWGVVILYYDYVIVTLEFLGRQSKFAQGPEQWVARGSSCRGR